MKSYEPSEGKHYPPNKSLLPRWIVIYSVGNTIQLLNKRELLCTVALKHGFHQQSKNDSSTTQAQEWAYKRKILILVL